MNLLGCSFPDALPSQEKRTPLPDVGRAQWRMSTIMAYRFDKPPGFDRDPFLHPLDAILADIAIAVQLPPGLHVKACDRYGGGANLRRAPGEPAAWTHPAVLSAGLDGD